MDEYIKYIIKQLPEDFVVKEISGIKLVDSGEYTVFRLKKKNYPTERAVQHIAKALRIDRKRIGYAGNKDRVAITEQNISVKGMKKDKAESLGLKDIELKFAGYCKGPISLGDLEGNQFEIAVRNISEQPKKVEKIINYYGEQRFSKNNAEIGKAIIKKDFKRAVDLILDSIGEQEERVIEHLKKDKNDFVGALKTMPWKVLNLYIHAYQSKLWNEIAKELVEKGVKENKKIPLIGFATEIRDKELKRIVEEIMQNEQIGYQDFVIRAIPDLSTDGSERELYAEVKDMEIGKPEDDELNKGKKKVKISFSLGRGSYATEVVKALFS